MLSGAGERSTKRLTQKNDHSLKRGTHSTVPAPVMPLTISILFIIPHAMRWLLLLVLLLNGFAVLGQVTSAFVIHKLPQQGVLLDKNWKWQAGDNPQWAKPEFDDRRWQPIDPTKDIMDLPQVRRSSVGWFRLRFSLKDSIPHQLALMVWQAGASEIYLDGKLIHQLGKLVGDTRAIKAFNPAGKPISFPTSPLTYHVLAVRYALQPNLTYTTIFLYENRGFKAVINTMEQSIDQYHQANDFEKSSFRIGIDFILAIIYLSFYLFYPVQRANLYISVFGFCQTCLWSLDLYIRFEPRIELQYLLHLIEFNLSVFATVLILWAVYSLLEQPKDWVFKVLFILGGGCMVAGTFIYGWGWVLYSVFFLNLTNIAFMRIAIKSVKYQRKGAWIILGGSTGFLICWGLFSLGLLGYIPTLPIDLFSIAQLSIPVTVALYMGYKSAITHRSLHYQLTEVERLSQEKQQLLATQNVMLERQLVQQTNEVMLERQLEEQRVSQLRSDFDRRVADTEMTALRAQMNPHFIFNCLNSIKLYTLDNEADRASDYLTKFSRLIRLVLENSRSELVSLQNELEALQLYSDLEAMRFKHKLQFRIQVAPEIDQRYVCIPPLLLQPYVENAIWHGLMHKPDGGTVSVEVSQPQDNLLHIEITDDGVGRERAAELKSKSAGTHKSFGMQVTADRLRMINQLYNTHTQAQVVDLIDSFGEACGTRVVLDIPI